MELFLAITNKWKKLTIALKNSVLEFKSELSLNQQNRLFVRSVFKEIIPIVDYCCNLYYF